MDYNANISIKMNDSSMFIIKLVLSTFVLFWNLICLYNLHSYFMIL